MDDDNTDFDCQACEIWEASRSAGVLVERPSTWSEELR